jgi:hypothetical protein
MKNIITIQHTQSIHHTNGMIGSWTDWELTDFGKGQAENIGKNLSEEINGKLGHSYGATIGLQMCKFNDKLKRVVCAGTIFGNQFFKETVPKWLEEYESIALNKKNNTLDKLDMPQDEIEWIENTDLDLMIAQLNAWNKWEGVEISDIKANLALYSGTKDNKEVVEYSTNNENEIKDHGIIVNTFEELEHVELVEKIDVISPWVLDFLLK